MENKIKEIKKEVLSKLNMVKDLKNTEKLRVEYLGRKGSLTLLLRKLGMLSPEERPKAGQLLNQTKREIEELLKIKGMKRLSCFHHHKISNIYYVVYWSCP